MKIIDLLNKIANGEEVQQFEYYGGTYRKSKKDNKYWCNGMWFDFDIDVLNDEVEIIEEDKEIEKCKNYNQFDDVDDYVDYLRTKIDEIIDKINNINIILSPSEIDIDKCKKIDYMENNQ